MEVTHCVLDTPGEVPSLRLSVSSLVELEREDTQGPSVRGAAEDEYLREINRQERAQFRHSCIIQRTNQSRKHDLGPQQSFRGIGADQVAVLLLRLICRHEDASAGRKASAGIAVTSICGLAAKSS